MSSSSASAISGLSYSITKTITTNVERTCRWTRMLHSHVQFNGSPCRPRGRDGARSTWTIRDRSDAIDRRHVTAQESARRSGASSIIPPPSGRIGAALSRLIVAGRRACMWSAMAAPDRSAPARQSRSQSGEPPRPAREPKQRSPDPCPCRAPSRHPVRRRSLRPSQRHHDTAGLSASGGAGPRMGDGFLV